MKRKWLVLVAILAVTCWSAVASADFIVPAGGSLTLTGASGSLSASATFSLNATSTQLTVLLTNTATVATTANGNVLTGLFFTPSAAATLTPVSAVLNGTPNATVIGGSFPAGGNVGGEWAYLAGLSGAPLGATAGISSAGLGLFGDPNFNGPNLTDPVALDGPNWGIVSASTTVEPGGNQGPFANNFTFFTLTVAGLNGGNLTLGNVSFQYGTALTEPNVPAVPIPPTALLLGSGLLGIIALGIRRRKE